jgi:hypothetical protein
MDWIYGNAAALAGLGALATVVTAVVPSFTWSAPPDSRRQLLPLRRRIRRRGLSSQSSPGPLLAHGAGCVALQRLPCTSSSVGALGV